MHVINLDFRFISLILELGLHNHRTTCTIEMVEDFITNMWGVHWCGVCTCCTPTILMDEMQLTHQLHIPVHLAKQVSYVLVQHVECALVWGAKCVHVRVCTGMGCIHVRVCTGVGCVHVRVCTCVGYVLVRVCTGVGCVHVRVCTCVGCVLVRVCTGVGCVYVRVCTDVGCVHVIVCTGVECIHV